jgi:hypothetical protein
MEAMAAESQISAGLDAQRAELEAVLQSKYFTRAPTLANLLSYLCEKLFAGEAHQIKEYSVGVEVFHRGPSFDQDSDSIVRVEANRLRKRLAEYYAEEGASHRLRIVIPLGQYVPDFESVTPVAEESEAAEQVAPGAGSTGIGSAAQTLAERWGRRPSSRTRWMVAVIALMLLIPSLVLLYLEKRAAPAAANQPAAQTAESQVGPPTGEEIRILAGSSRSFVDHAGKLWNADAWFAGGTAVKNTVVQIWRTQNPDFYRTSRQGNFSYAIPLKNGLYELHLHFAETVYGPDAAEAGGEGSRILSVHANGDDMLPACAGKSDLRKGEIEVLPHVVRNGCILVVPWNGCGHGRNAGGGGGRRGKLIAGASSEHAPFKTAHPGWAEQDPEDWWRAAQEAIRGALASGA